MIFLAHYLFADIACAQSTTALQKEILTVTYLENKKFRVKFQADAQFPTAQGEAEIELNNKGETTIKAEFKNLTSVLDIGGRYSTYVLWAVAHDGSVRFLGELDTNAKDDFSDAKLERKIPISSFGLMVTAEPYGLVRLPSRSVTLTAGKPSGANAPLAAFRMVACAFSEYDYSGSRETFDKKNKAERQREKDFRRTIPQVFGAEYAIATAREAGADDFAAELINDADAQFQKLDSLVKGKGEERQIIQQANKTIALAADAETKSVAGKKRRRDELAKSKADSILTQTQEELKKTQEDRDRDREELARMTQRKESLERDFQETDSRNRRLDEANRRLLVESDEVKTENVRLKIEVGTLRDNMRRYRGAKEFPADVPDLKRYLADFGSVQGNSTDGVTLTLQETIWMYPDSDKIGSENIPKLNLLAQKLSEVDYLAVHVVSYRATTEDGVAGQSFADRRVKAMADHLIKAGVAPDRVFKKPFSFQSENEKPARKAGQVNSSRIDIVLKPID